MQYIPFTTKDDIRDNYPFGMLAVPMKDIVRIHASSGTTGKPTVGAYTKEDIENWSDFVARIVTASGVTSEDIIQISFGYGLFTGALGLHFGLEKVGATVIPASSGNSQKQLMMLRDFGVTGLVATPSYALYLGELVRESPYPKEAYASLKYGILGSEGCTEEMRQRIEENLGVTVTDNYGMTELTGPGVSGECHLRCGLHFAEDAFLPEIIDQDTLEQKARRRGRRAGGHHPDPPGHAGAALPHQGHHPPELRALRLRPHPCAHGKGDGPHRRYAHHQGGQRVPQPDRERAGGHGERGSPLPAGGAQAQLPGYPGGQGGTYATAPCWKVLENCKSLQHKIHDRLKSVLGLETKVTLVSPKSLERFQGKAKRVLDLRNQPEE